MRTVAWPRPLARRCSCIDSAHAHAHARFSLAEPRPYFRTGPLALPELPEVETIRRRLAPAVERTRLERLEVLDPRWSAPAPPGETEDAVRDRRIERLRRRGKYLIWELEGEVFLLMHLRMTGTLLIVPEADYDADTNYVRARLMLDSGERVFFRDPRRFGTGIVVAGTPALDRYLGDRLGIEPLDA
ncbi:MAG: DNA-formamidopyrimidine glycosylase family protein, partial [Thermoleophilaceae bacterium]